MENLILNRKEDAIDIEELCRKYIQIAKEMSDDEQLETVGTILDSFSGVPFSDDGEPNILYTVPFVAPLREKAQSYFREIAPLKKRQACYDESRSSILGSLENRGLLRLVLFGESISNDDAA